MREFKLIDVIDDYQEKVHFGTCEMCMRVGPNTFSTFVFEVDGERREIKGWFWSWGSLFDVYIENTADFAWWLHEHPEAYEKVEDLRDYADLSLLVDYYRKAP